MNKDGSWKWCLSLHKVKQFTISNTISKLVRIKVNCFYLTSCITVFCLFKCPYIWWFYYWYVVLSCLSCCTMHQVPNNVCCIGKTLNKHIRIYWCLLPPCQCQYLASVTQKGNSQNFRDCSKIFVILQRAECIFIHVVWGVFGDSGKYLPKCFFFFFKDQNIFIFYGNKMLCDWM